MNSLNSPITTLTEIRNKANDAPNSQEYITAIGGANRKIAELENRIQNLEKMVRAMMVVNPTTKALEDVPKKHQYRSPTAPVYPLF